MPPTLGVSQKWLPRSLYKAQNTPCRAITAFSPAITVSVDFFFHQLRVIDLAGGIVENHQQVVPALVSGKGGESASRNVQLDLLAKAGPPVFVLGLLVLLSVAVSAPAKSALDRAVSQHSWGMLILLAVVPLAIFLLFGWRVDVNEFSLNPFYRNRLTRCYLGASNRKRAPNPLTGFDNRDTRGMQISRLRPIPVPQPQLALVRPRPTEIYTGPFPIICTAINLSFGEDLAWQERKAASFAFYSSLLRLSCLLDNRQA